jgi:hypothetical protein
MADVAQKCISANPERHGTAVVLCSRRTSSLLIENANRAITAGAGRNYMDAATLETKLGTRLDSYNLPSGYF